ncbi:hypothetical protein PR202_ga16979 [Eleusine coracana subsp. coracana]|uniref:Uncharacterized protein n=1 Tax=Eleusine coracana subsp. coracana TaxID=191504 RepID=A0AAV5CPB1_ELECO|nr:hypothetical protein PR202_ga16979 [Eleusine coracana subsp. coracana]
MHYRLNYISQGGSGNCARANLARKTKEVEHMLANLEKEGVEIDDKIVSIIDDEVARIKDEAARDNINEPKRDWNMILDNIAYIGIGFMVGAECCLCAIRGAVIQKLLFG